MVQSKTRLALPGEHAAAHFGALLKLVRHRQGVRQLEVLAHLPGWTQATYSRVETGEVAPAFDQLAPIYRALRLAGVELSAADRQQFLTLARLRIEAKKTYQEHRSDAEWDELRLRLSHTEQDAGVNVQPAPRQRPVSASPRLVETRHLVGREDWLASIVVSLQEALPKKLIVLQGPVGIGKSSELHRLALHMLCAASSPFQICLCELPAAEQEADPESALDLLLGSLLVELTLSDASLSLPSLDQRITYALRGLEKASRPVLLFIDNGERLLDEKGRFAPCWERFLQRFLRSQHRSTLVLATREWPGWFEGERAFVIERTVPPLSGEAGVWLLQQLGLTDVPDEYLRRASEAVGGVPLCLEWLASLVQEPMWLDEWQEDDDPDGQEEGASEHVSTRRLLRLLEDASLFGGPIAAKLHPLLERIIEQRLSAEAYQVLCTLALAHVPLGKPALQLICPRPRLLKELSATSLLVANPKRVQVLPMVASAVRARLSHEQQHALESRLIASYSSWLDAGRVDDHELGRIIAELVVLYLKHDRLLDAAVLLIQYGWLSFNLGYGARLAHLTQDALSRPNWHATAEDECAGFVLRHILFPFLGRSVDAQQDVDTQRLREALLSGTVALPAAAEDYVIQLFLLDAINELRFEEALMLLDDYAVRLESRGRPSAKPRTALLQKRALLFGTWCEYAEEQGETPQAQALREQAIALYRQCDVLLSSKESASPLKGKLRKKRLASYLNSLSYHLNRIGRYEEALEAAERAIALQEQGYVYVGGLAASYGEKSQILMRLGRFQEALLFDEKAVAEVQRCADAGDVLSQEERWIYQVNRGRLFLRLGRVDEAERLLREALPFIHVRRRMYRMFAREALAEIEQWRRQTTTPSYQLDWRWLERYRSLASFDSYRWLSWAGPFTEEEHQRWDQALALLPDEAAREQQDALLLHSRERELAAALAEQREPRLCYPAIDIAEVRQRIAAFLQLATEISQQEPNAVVRRLYQQTITEEIDFLRLIEATYEGNAGRFWECNRRLFPLPTAEEMREALARVEQALQQGFSRPETLDVSQHLDEFLRTRLHLVLTHPTQQTATQERQAEEQSPTPQRKVSAQAVRRFFAAILEQGGYEGWRVVVDTNATNARVEQGLRQVFLPQQRYSLEQIRHLFVHELLGHVAQCVAGERSPLGLLGIHTHNSQPTEEGLALYYERQMAALRGQPFDDSGILNGTLATGLAGGVVTPPLTFLSLFTFFELFSFLKRLLKRPHMDKQKAQKQAQAYALALCLRTYRGVPDLSRPGICYSQDAVHLHGLRLIEQAAAQDATVLDRLSVGVVALEHLPDLQELGILSSPQPLRGLAYDPDLDSRILSFAEREEEEAKHL
jgi:hypothetical protein